METIKGIYQDDYDQAVKNLNLIKRRGDHPHDYIARSILMDMFEYEEGWIPLKPAQQSCWDQVSSGELSKSTLDEARRHMYNSNGLLLYKKKATTSYLMITELGKEFISWLLSEEGMKWGNRTAQRIVKSSPSEAKKEGDYSKPYFQGGLVNAHLPTEPIVMDNVSANKHGLLLAYVPAGVEIVWVEEVKGEDGSVKKKKPHKIKRKSDEPELSPEEKRIKELKAELAALGVEDI